MAMPKPTPRHAPCTAAMVGTGSSAMRAISGLNTSREDRRRVLGERLGGRQVAAGGEATTLAADEHARARPAARVENRVELGDHARRRAS